MEALVVLVSLLLSLLVTIALVAVPLLVTALVFVLLLVFSVWFARALSTVELPKGMVLAGPSIQVSGLGVDLWALMLASRPAPKPGCEWVKRTSCPACGAPKQRPSRFAYVSCDHCGELMDFDFQAAVSDRRSRLPGPEYERLLAQHRPALERARKVEDREAYRALQRQLFDAYVSACPAAVSPRVGDPAYRARLVDWSADAQVVQDFDPVCRGAFDAMQGVTRSLAWDRSNPLAPKVRFDDFLVLVDVVKAHQEAYVAAVDAAGLLERHPDRPAPELLARIGLSTLVQGWLPYLPADDIPTAIEVAGLQGDYAELEAPTLREGPCPSCGAPVEVVEGAKRVLCGACGHMVGVAPGALRCHGCGDAIEVPEDAETFACPSCSVALRRMRWA